MQRPNLTKIHTALDKSSLSQEDKDLLYVFYSYTKDENLTPVVELLEGDISMANVLLENAKAKQTAVFSQDPASSWQKVFEKEGALMEGVAKG